MATIAAATLDDPDVAALIGELNRELADRYPEEGANHFRLDPDEVAPGRGVLLLLRDETGAAQACGAVRKINADEAELKRMYTRPACRGRGYARRILGALEGVASDLGATRLVLETGSRQTEAIAMYEGAGYKPVAPWGEYIDSPLSLCLGKTLA